MDRFLLMSPHKWEPASPPLALDYIAWELEKHGIHSDIVDISFMEDVNGELLQLFQDTQYRGVCVTIRNLDATTSPDRLNFPLPSIRDLISFMKSQVSCPIIVGGNGFSISPRKILEYVGADYGIWGPGEEFLPPLLQFIQTGRGDVTSIPHVVYMKKGTVFKNPGMVSSTYLPPVRRGYVHYENYYTPGLENHAGFANIETTRGCPHSCCYCVEPSIKGKAVRVKPPETVTREIEWFMNKGIYYFFMTDSEFNADHRAAESLCEYWIKTGYASKMKWVAYATPAHFSEKLASSIMRSGNLSLMVDFGHVSNPILNRLGKSYDSRIVEETVNICEVNHLNYRGSLMLGGPGETRETVKEAIDFFKGLTCKVFVVIGIRIFPNTPLAEVVRAAGPLVDNPHVYGKVMDNDDLLEPVFYISQDLGEDIYTYMTHLVGNSEQFYTPFQLNLLTKEMYGPFRGFKPDYTPCAKTESRYITRYSHDELKSRIFDEKQGD